MQTVLETHLMRTAVVQLQLSGHIHRAKAICIAAGWDVSSKVPFLSKHWFVRTNFFFFQMKTNNFQELKTFLRSITQYPKRVCLTWLYFYLKHDNRELMHVCYGPVKIIYVNVGQKLERLLSCQGYGEQHPWRHFTNRASPCPLLRHHHEPKKEWDLNRSLPHTRKYRMILHQNSIL